MADIIRRGRECRRESGLDVQVVVMAPAGVPGPVSSGAVGRDEAVASAVSASRLDDLFHAPPTSTTYHDAPTRSESCGSASTVYSKVCEQDQSLAKTKSGGSFSKGASGHGRVSASIERDSLELEPACARLRVVCEPSGGPIAGDHASKIEAMRQQCENLLGLGRVAALTAH